MSVQTVEQFSIRRVLGSVQRAIADNLPTILVLGAVLVILPDVGVSWAMGPKADVWTTTRVANLIGATVGLLFKVSIVHAAMRTLDGKPAPIGDSLSAGMRLFFPAFGIAWLTNMGVFLGLILLIFPGVMLMTRWCVALPARMARGEGVTDAISRSTALTAGSRLPIAGLFALALVALVVVYFMLGVLSYALAGDGPSVLVDRVLTPIVDLVSVTVSACATAAIYHELIRIKGGGAKETADIFA